MTETLSHAPAADDGAERPLTPALVRGWRRCCPACGAGPMLRGYLKVRDNCPVCGEELHHQRADDGPAYLTIMVVGHVIAPALMLSDADWAPEPLVMAAGLSVVAVGLSLWLLPRLKGAFVALQWAKRMHGFSAGPALD